MANRYQGGSLDQTAPHLYAHGILSGGDTTITQRQMIIERLREYKSDIAAVASSMNVSRATMYRRLKKLNINLKTDI